MGVVSKFNAHAQNGFRLSYQLFMCMSALIVCVATYRRAVDSNGKVGGG